MAREGASVDTLCAGNVPTAQVFLERMFRAPVARAFAQFLDHESPQVRVSDLGVGRVRAVVANARISHGNDLAAIRAIGQHVRVAGHGSVEANLADRGPVCAKRLPFEYPSVFESEKR